MYRGMKFGELGVKIVVRGTRGKLTFVKIGTEKLKESVIRGADGGLKGGELGMIRFRDPLVPGTLNALEFEKKSSGRRAVTFFDFEVNDTVEEMKLEKIETQKSNDSEDCGAHSGLKLEIFGKQKFHDYVVRGTRGGRKLGIFGKQKFHDYVVRGTRGGLKLGKLETQKSSDSEDCGAHGGRNLGIFGNQKFLDYVVRSTRGGLELVNFGKQKFHDYVVRFKRSGLKLEKLETQKSSYSEDCGANGGRKLGIFGKQKFHDYVVRCTRGGLKLGKLETQKSSYSEDCGSNDGRKLGIFEKQKFHDYIMRGTRSRLKLENFKMQKFSDFGVATFKKSLAHFTRDACRGTKFGEHARKLQTVVSEIVKGDLQIQILASRKCSKFKWRRSGLKKLHKSSRRGRRSKEKWAIDPEILKLLIKYGHLLLIVPLHAVYPGSEYVIYFGKAALHYHKGNTNEALRSIIKGVIAMKFGPLQTQSTEC